MFKQWVLFCEKLQELLNAGFGATNFVADVGSLGKCAFYTSFLGDGPADRLDDFALVDEVSGEQLGFLKGVVADCVVTSFGVLSNGSEVLANIFLFHNYNN